MQMVKAIIVLLALSLSLAPVRGSAQSVPIITCTSPLGSSPTGVIVRPCTPVGLRAAIVITGGTYVQAFQSGDIPFGGWIYNPSTATNALCISTVGNASVTNDIVTTCIPPGWSLPIVAQTNGVTVNSSDSSHAFSGTGYK